MTRIGLQVTEGEAPITPAVNPAELGVVGALIESIRGIPGVAVPVTNLVDFRELYGGPSLSCFGYYALRGLFKNAQEVGARVYVVRVTNGTAAPAASTVDFEDGSAALAFTVKAGQYGQEDPGAWGDNVNVDLAESPADATKFDITVKYNGVQKEKWEYLDITTIASAINHSQNGSRYIMVTAVDTTKTPAVANHDLASGSDGTAPVTADHDAALTALDGIELDVIFDTEETGSAQAATLDTYCSGRGDVLGLVSAAYADTPTGVDFDTELSIKSFVAAYLGWLEVDDEFNGTIWIPNVGHVAGAAYIRKAMQRGGYPHIAPAGADTKLRDVVKIQYPNIDPDDLGALVKTKGLNAIMYIRGAGFIVRTSRTLSTLGKNYSAHVRRLLNHIVKSFKSSLIWVEQEANTPETRGRLADSIRFYLNSLRDAGAFDREANLGTNGFLVKCDTENNPASVRDARELVCDVLINPAEVAETVKVTLYNAKGLTITEE